jgi:hypothetical protein
VLKRLVAVLSSTVLASAALVGVGAAPALAATCTYNGGGQFGADLKGWLPDLGLTTGPVQTAQGIIYDLVGYTDLPAGCVAGELDLVSYTTNGTAGTCTLVLPVPVITGGTGCANLLGDAGAGVTLGRPYGFQLTVRAELVAVGADGSRVTRLSAPCVGYLDQFYFNSFRCPL